MSTATRASREGDGLALGRVLAHRHVEKAFLRLCRQHFEEAVTDLISPAVARPLNVVAADERASQMLWNAGSRARRIVRPDAWSALDDDASLSTLPIRQCTADISVAVRSLTRRSPAEARRRINELWRVTRPAGRILVIDDFVRHENRPDQRPPMDMTTFLELLALGTGTRVSLSSISSFRLPGDDVTRGGAVVAVRLGGRTP